MAETAFEVEIENGHLDSQHQKITRVVFIWIFVNRTVVRINDKLREAGGVGVSVYGVMILAGMMVVAGAVGLGLGLRCVGGGGGAEGGAEACGRRARGEDKYV